MNLKVSQDGKKLSVDFDLSQTLAKKGEMTKADPPKARKCDLVDGSGGSHSFCTPDGTQYAFNANVFRK